MKSAVLNAAAVVTFVAAAAAQTAQKTRTPEEILDYHVKNEKGGVAADGREMYEARCAACHRFGPIGKDVGPDLTTLASRFKKKDVLEAILWPSKVISDQYQAEVFELNDGKIVAGFIVRETAKAVLVRTADNPDKPVVVTLANVANRVPAEISLMPAALIDDLTDKQIADLLAFVLAPPPVK